MNPNTDEKIKQAISAWVDGEADAQETQIAQSAVQENAKYREYLNELKKLSLVAKQWKDEEFSTDLNRKFEKIKNREGIAMKNTVKKISPKVAGSLVMASVAAFILVVYTPHLTKPIMPVPEKGEMKRTPPISVVEKTVSRGAPAVTAAALAPQTIGKVFVKKEVLEPQVVAAGASMNQAESRKSSYFNGARHQVAEAVFSARLSDSRMKSEAVYDRAVSPSISWVDRDARESNTESYNTVDETSFKNVIDSPLSTFSIDVDTASYANLRRFLTSEQMLPKDAVRIEEMINYFHYDYPEPAKNEPFSITTEISPCPWMKEHSLVLIGLKGKSLDVKNLPPSNLVFLIDVSGSMEEPNKLPLLQKALSKLVNQLSGNEKVAIVTYAGNAGLVLPSTSATEKSKILQAIENLSAGGSTAGGQGIELAYQTAKENFIKDGNNRVILATDGDFNVGVSSDAELVRIIEEKRGLGIFLTVLGFGEGNYKDSKMQQLADKGNGNYFYIDTLREAQKVLVHELGSTLFTIAKDVKLQVEFNPAYVKSYRLIGYEKRALANEDFKNDKKDAGELGAGHTVTALYEIVPQDSKEDIASSVDPLKYQASQVKKSKELLTVKMRYKEPNANESKPLEKILAAGDPAKAASENMKQASAVAEFGLLLRKSEFKANASYTHVLDVLKGLKGEDQENYRAELVQLVEKAKSLDETSIDGIKFKQ